MQVTIVSNLTFSALCTITDVPYSLSIEALKERISKETKMNVSTFYLRRGDRKLTDDNILGECFFGNQEITLVLVHSFQQRTCPLCLEADYNRPNWGIPHGKDPVFFACHHQVHYECYVALLKTHSKCPECAREISFEEHSPATYKSLLQTCQAIE